MSDVRIDIKELERLEQSLKKAGIKADRGHKRLFKELGVGITQLAKKYCPESPQLKDYRKMNKSGKCNKKASDITSGSLRDSIQYEAEKDFVSIYVPANAKGGGYAEKIHDEKGKSWRHRGVRTKQKGADADEKFIYRAGEKRSKQVEELVDKVIEDLTKGIGA